MQATLSIDDDLLNEAASLASVQDASKLVEMALVEFVANHKAAKKRDVRELVGAVEIAPDYDYKKQRAGEI